MANFSRDTYRLTNAAHRLITNDAVTDPRHYVAVRVQQGVPVVDADLNELDEIRRREHEITLRELIGDGVPGLGDGFAIAPIEAPNDFLILPGLVVVGGWQVINLEPLRYSELPRFLDTDGVFEGVDLTTPASDRIDLVYLDVWEEEVASTGPGADARLVNDVIGLETSVRIERRWTVRVAEEETEFAGLELADAGHSYLLLARLYRTAASAILPSMIEDRRRLGLNLAEALRPPLFVRRGTQVMNPSRYINMLRGLREALRGWQEDGLFPVVLSTPEEQARFQNGLNHIYYLVTAGEVATLAGSLDNVAALAVLLELVDAQARLIAVVRDLGTGDPDEMAAIDTLEGYLEGDAPSGIGGVRPPIERDDLLGAVRAQEVLTGWLGLGTGEIPQGDVSVALQSIEPPGLIAAGATLTAVYEVTSHLVVPAEAEEVFDLIEESSDNRWALELSSNEVSLAPGQSAQVTLLITPGETLDPDNVTAISLIAHARRRPSIVSPQPAIHLTIGQLPPGEQFFFYSGVPLTGGELVVDPGDIAETVFEVTCTVVNTEGPAITQGFRIEHELIWPVVVPPGVDPGDWTPASPQVVPNFLVPGTERTAPFVLVGPSLAGVSQDVTFTLHMTVTLVSEDGSPVSDGKSNTIDLPIRVDVA